MGTKAERNIKIVICTLFFFKLTYDVQAVFENLKCENRNQFLPPEVGSTVVERPMSDN